MAIFVDKGCSIDENPIIAYALVKLMQKKFDTVKADLIANTNTFGSISLLLSPAQIKLVIMEHQRIIGNYWDDKVKQINQMVVQACLNDTKKKRKNESIKEKPKVVYDDPYDEDGILCLEEDIPVSLRDNNGPEYKEDWEMDFEEINKSWLEKGMVMQDTYATEIADIIVEFYTNPLFIIKCSKWYHKFFS